MTVRAAIATSSAQGRADDWFVLSGRIRGVALEGTSRYRDAIWYLGPAERLGHAARYSLHYSAVPEPFREVAKELFAELLDDDLTPNGRPYSIASIKQHFSALSEFLRFLASKGLTRVSDAAPIHFAEYIGYLEGAERLNTRMVRGPRLLWEYRIRLSDPMTSDPRAVPFWRTRNSPDSGTENLTSRIPESVLTPLIWWCCRFVDDFSVDILNAQIDYRKLRSQSARGVESRPRAQYGATGARVRTLLEEYQRTGDPLPGISSGTYKGRPNFLALDRDAGVPRGSVRQVAKDDVDSLAQTNGVAEDFYMPTRASALLLGEVWTDRIAYREVPTLLKHLQTAAYIIVAFFSGMRDSEVKHIERGCITDDMDSTGKLAIYLLDGRAFKGNTEPTGKPARWVVAPVVKRAIAVLEALTDVSETRLFTPLREGTSQDRPGNRELVTTQETNRAIAKLFDWVSDYTLDHAHTPSIPLVDGKRWYLTTKQFRRTLAWFIARRPGGIAAGALQYKHLSLQMFRGYAGESESGFAAEVAAEHALARGEWLGEFAADAETVVGRAKEEVVRRLDQMGQSLGFAGHLPDNPKQLARFLKRHDPHIYRGAAVTCVFDSAKALCLRKDPDAPDFQTCEPLKCGNAVFAPADIRIWRERAGGLAEVSANESLAPRVRASAAEHSARLTKFLNSIEAAE